MTILLRLRYTSSMTKTQTPAAKRPTIAELLAIAEELRCPDGMRTPFNSRPLPTSRKALVEVIRGLRQAADDSWAIERQGR